MGKMYSMYNKFSVGYFITYGKYFNNEMKSFNNQVKRFNNKLKGLYTKK